jgi:DNA ligase-1
MRAFTQLYFDLDQTNKTSAKLKCLRTYFSRVSDEDAAWALFFLIGQRIMRLVKLKDLKLWASEYSGFSDWMLAECYDHVGDLAETLALLTHADAETDTDTDTDTALANSRIEEGFSDFIEKSLIPLRDLEPEMQGERIQSLWRQMSRSECLVFNKLITGGFRVGVSKTLVIKALAENAGLDPALMAHQLMGQWEPSAEQFRALFDVDLAKRDVGKPFPFCLAYPLEFKEGESLDLVLGASEDWQCEPKWDGIRAQMIYRDRQCILWSRGEQLLNEQVPELSEAIQSCERSFVLDGELLAWDLKKDSVQSFSDLQIRLGRKKVSAQIQQSVPVIFMAYDLLELEGSDLRSMGMFDRRKHLEDLMASLDCSLLRLSPVFDASLGWEAMARERMQSRERRVEGLMLKHGQAAYISGRKKGLWWKWKVEPYTADAVLVYAQQGHGRRAGVFSDYTFSIWKGDQLVPFCKAYSGLSDAEMQSVDRWIRSNTVSKHGPVRVVKPELVFEIAFEGVQESSRHKSGIAVRFPRIHRWRRDKPTSEADSLDTIRTLL